MTWLSASQVDDVGTPALKRAMSTVLAFAIPVIMLSAVPEELVRCSQSLGFRGEAPLELVKVSNASKEMGFPQFEPLDPGFTVSVVLLSRGCSQGVLSWPGPSAVCPTSA